MTTPVNDRHELVLLLREVMRWEKRSHTDVLNRDKIRWDHLRDILNRAHVAISTDSRHRPRQRKQWQRC